MYINSMGSYVPTQRIDNDYFKNVNGLDADWIFQRTGICTRSKAAPLKKPFLSLSVFLNSFRKKFRKLSLN